jgi:hypothetical protein
MLYVLIALVCHFGGVVSLNSTVFLPSAFLTNPCADNTPFLPVFGGFPYPSGNAPAAINEIQPRGLGIPRGGKAPLPISCSAYDPVSTWLVHRSMTSVFNLTMEYTYMTAFWLQVTDQLILVGMTASSLNFSSTGSGNATALAEEHYQAERTSHSFAVFTSNTSGSCCKCNG